MFIFKFYIQKLNYYVHVQYVQVKLCADFIWAFFRPYTVKIVFEAKKAFHCSQYEEMTALNCVLCDKRHL